MILMNKIFSFKVLVNPKFILLKKMMPTYLLGTFPTKININHSNALIYHARCSSLVRYFGFVLFVYLQIQLNMT